MKMFTFSRFALRALLGVSISVMPGLASAGWVRQNSGTGLYLYSVHFPLNASTGYAVGASGTILMTSDGGAAWVNQPSGIGQYLLSVHFPVDAATGFAVGEAGIILKTTNGGANWFPQTSDTTNWLSSVHFPLNAQTGYAVGGAGTILKTTDGGAAWVRQTMGTTRWLLAVHFPLDASTGYAVGGWPDSSIILKTTDGGASWDTQTSGATDPLYSVHFPVNALTGYAAGWHGTILKTIDGGSGVEETAEVRSQRLEVRLTAKPNPFTSFATLPGHEAERFSLYDVSGRKVGTFRGDRVGEGLAPGVYFLCKGTACRAPTTAPLRIVKVR